jgi:hypothetical protein
MTPQRGCGRGGRVGMRRVFGASARTAAVAAAYAIITKLYPATPALIAARTASLAAIPESASAIDKGVEWGNAVAEQVWTFCQTDGFSAVSAPYSGETALGEWRSQNAANAGLQFPGMGGPRVCGYSS